MADLGLKQTSILRFAYETLCWGTFIKTWSQSWDIVTAVDRPNFGLCLDTFYIAGRKWADPSRLEGQVDNADEDLKGSLVRLVKEIDVSKVSMYNLTMMRR
jgi:4-hydroxyphenylpyruvate dioxygenase